MMDSDNPHPPPSTYIPIAQISPVLDRLEGHSIRAVVTLVWPYSSATKSLSLLLAEPDFRLRRANGQVKVIFYGFVAERIAKTHVGIGDEVTLSLAGSRLVNNETTGNCMAWDVHFDDRVLLEIYRALEHLSTVNIEPPVEPPQTVEETPIPPSTPQNASFRLGGTAPDAGLGSWGSPAFLRSSRTSFGGLLDTPLDPFAEEDGFIPGKGRKRPRFSMRSNDWRVIDEPETSQEKEPVDWMEMLEDEISEPEAEGQDVQAAEPPTATISVQEAQEVPDIIESQDTSTIQPIPESFEAQRGPDPDHVVGPSAQSLESDTSRHYEQTEDKTGTKDLLNPFIHLPIDTPHLLPVPSPGLPVPSPLVTSNNPSGYFSSVSTSTTQTPNGGFLTTETRTVMAKTETTADYREQFHAPPSQMTGTLDSEMRDQRSPSTEYIPKTLEDASITQIPGPSIVKEPASPVNTPNVHSKEGTELAPEHEDKFNQLEYAAERASEERERLVEDVAQYSDEESEADEREESDVDQVYDEEDLQEEDEWSEEHESGDDMDEDEPNVSRQSFEPNDSRGRSQVEPINLDSDEDEVEAEREEAPNNVGKVEAGVPPTMHGDIEGDRSHHLDDREEEEEEEEDEDKEGGKRASDVDIDERVESAAEKNDEINGHSDEQYGKYDDEEEDDEEAEEEGEEAYDNEMSDYYESENERPADYNDYVNSELESEYGDDEDGYQQPPPPKNVQPEVIVLDSDSDEEPPPSHHAQPTEQPKQDVSEDQEPTPRAPSATEYSLPSESSGFEEEVMSASAKEEYDTEEQPGYGQMVLRKIEEQREEEDEDEEEEEEEESEDDQKEENQEGGEELEAAMIEDKEADVRLHDQPTVDEQIEPRQDEGDRIEDKEMQDKQVEDEQVEDEQMDDAWNEPINAPMPDSASATGIQDDLDETRTPDPTAPVHGPALEHPVEQPHTAPESTTDTDLAIDPNLLGMQANTEESTPKRAVEQEMTHVEVRQKEPEQPPDESDMGGRVDNPIWLDGVASMGGAPVSVKDSSILPEVQHQQPATPSDSQDVDTERQVITSNTVNEALPTPQYTQEELLDSTLQHQVYASASASKDAASPIQHGSEPDSFVIAPESQIEASEAPPHETVEANHDGDISGENGEDESPVASEKFFSPVGPGRDTHGLRPKPTGSTPLATLIDNIDSLVDTISVAWEVSPTIQSTSEPKDHILTVRVTDPSMAGTSLPVQITRPHNETLPQLNEGDALLLRNFKVQGLNGSPMLASGDASSWAVFRDSENSIQVDGPLAEYNAEERDYAAGIRQWYHEAGAAMAADNQLQASIEVASMEGTPVSSVGVSDDESFGSPIPGSSPSVAKRKRRKRRSHRKITIHELRDGRRYTQVGSPSDKSSIHQLRDGTVYANP